MVFHRAQKNTEKRQPYSKTLNLSLKRRPQEEKREKGLEKNRRFTPKREDWGKNTNQCGTLKQRGSQREARDSFQDCTCWHSQPLCPPFLFWATELTDTLGKGQNVPIFPPLFPNPRKIGKWKIQDLAIALYVSVINVLHNSTNTLTWFQYPPFLPVTLIQLTTNGNREKAHTWHRTVNVQL